MLFGRYVQTWVSLGLLLISVTAFAENVHFDDLKMRLNTIQEDVFSHRLQLSSLNRPQTCPVMGTTFKDLADQMGAVSNALAASSCFTKYAKVISDINDFSKKQASRRAFDDSPAENGSFAEYNPSTLINITNNQIQNVNNSNSLINGLFEISKDRECIDVLRKDRRLATVAEALTRFGAIGVFFPSSIGMMGAALVMGTGGALYVVDKLIQPEFHWNLDQDRNDFMSLTCAFYHLRNQLHTYGFFERSPENANELKETASGLQEKLSGIERELRERNQKWGDLKRTQINQLLFPTVLTQENMELYFLLRQGLETLESPAAFGGTPNDRYSTMLYFAKNYQHYVSLIEKSEINPGLKTKTLKQIRSLANLPSTELMQLTSRTWQNVHMTSLKTFFNEIIVDHFSNVLDVMNRFWKRTDFGTLTNEALNSRLKVDYDSLLAQAAKIKSDLEIKVSNMERQRNEIPYSALGEGALDQINIRIEYDKITHIVLGKKGWKFLHYLASDARKNIIKFRKYYARWKKTKDNQVLRSDACNNAFQLAKIWDKANYEAEASFQFLSANDDLWSDYRSKVRTVLKVIPVGQSYLDKLNYERKSALYAKRYLQSRNEDYAKMVKKMSSLWAFRVFGFNLGKIIIDVDSHKAGRAEIDEFQAQYCRGRAEQLESAFEEEALISGEYPKSEGFSLTTLHVGAVEHQLDASTPETPVAPIPPQ